MLISAVYTGKDGSLGYRTGQAYKLRIYGNSIMREAQEGWCPYSNLQTFLRNWTNVRVLSK